MGGDEGLVAGDDGGAGLEGCQDEGAGGLDATDELDDEVIAGGDGGGVVGEELAGEVGVARGAHVAHGDAGDLQAGAGAGGEVVGLLAKEADDLAADGAGAEDADGEGARCGPLGVLSHV